MSDSAQIAAASTLSEPDGVEQLLARWLPQQRWFASKGSGAGQEQDGDSAAIPAAVGERATLTMVGRLTLTDPSRPEVDVRVELVRAAGAVYQVPLTLRSAAEPLLEHALIGRADGRWVYDGPHDPAFVRAWLQVITETSTPDGSGSAGAVPAVSAPAVSAAGARVTDVVARGVRPADGLPIDPEAPSSVLRGEQSNTSVIVGAGTANPLIVKVFRVLAPGQNPDVVVQSALARAGCLRVPRPAGWVEATWRLEPGGEPVTGDLAYACEFMPGSEDAWRVAVRAVEEAASFADAARELGAATAQVHAVLADVLPRHRATGEELAGLADALHRRVDWALVQAPVLTPFVVGARAVVDAVRQVEHVPDLQQVHGDFHLGQVLHSPSRGWILLDFEGEPLRPLAERMRPDLALRDVAGMLRSFDYAAKHATVGLPDDDPRVAAAEAWADDARAAFLAGYGEVSGRDPGADVTLLRALELDKALYEVVYEVGNRPSWVPIPLAAVRRLLPNA